MVPEPIETEPASGATQHEGTGSRGRGPVVLSAAALVVSLAALAVAGLTALSGGHDKDDDAAQAAAPTYSDEERAHAKKQLCDAVDIVRSGVASTANAEAPGGPNDIVGGIAVGANARLALSVGGQYLMTNIVAATPEDLARPATDLARSLIEIGATATAGVPATNADQRARMERAEKLTAELVAECARD
ncbi:putative alanine and proline rich membrane protein [Mycolicibacterium phlei]|jgi:hypothetical protein|uniref:hypothetical protein n=1 Tax=Mycolicibacterium phlei TaxID=1771 RepID=UPI00078D5FD4|nr:hypothetical protein [Mycolicibacterium phlei]AMO59407.1 hypothetical protein MPHLCCUG_00569 [Mycolicibacterium phlei]STZ15829.1 putative alanine and proline rich membrane protein [Mycolicibacterium phlei]VEG07537.1 putative alanine and proline rich membrane protein [Mycobacteroides chelonae]